MSKGFNGLVHTDAILYNPHLGQDLAHFAFFPHESPLAHVSHSPNESNVSLALHTPASHIKCTTTETQAAYFNAQQRIVNRCVTHLANGEHIVTERQSIGSGYIGNIPDSKPHRIHTPFGRISNMDPLKTFLKKAYNHDASFDIFKPNTPIHFAPAKDEDTGQDSDEHFFQMEFAQSHHISLRVYIPFSCKSNFTAVRSDSNSKQFFIKATPSCVLSEDEYTEVLDEYMFALEMSTLTPDEYIQKDLFKPTPLKTTPLAPIVAFNHIKPPVAFSSSHKLAEKFNNGLDAQGGNPLECQVTDVSKSDYHVKCFAMDFILKGKYVFEQYKVTEGGESYGKTLWSDEAVDFSMEEQLDRVQMYVSEEDMEMVDVYLAKKEVFNKVFSEMSGVEEDALGNDIAEGVLISSKTGMVYFMRYGGSEDAFERFKFTGVVSGENCDLSGSLMDYELPRGGIVVGNKVFGMDMVSKIAMRGTGINRLEDIPKSFVYNGEIDHGVRV